ncbi:MAG: NRAMP family divalent metal transporter [Spirosomataceae bacterium]
MLKSRNSSLLGAVFLMATSAVGPGFLTQTALFTKELLYSFGFVLILSTLLDIIIQLTIWQHVTKTGMRAQQLANTAIPYAGTVLALLVSFGGIAFNIGNLAGAALGLSLVFPSLSLIQAACISGSIAVFVFYQPFLKSGLDFFTVLMGLLLICLLLVAVFYVDFSPQKVVQFTVFPTRFDPIITLTLVGGTVGGYISFAGAHRLIDQGIVGEEVQLFVRKSAVTGILMTALIRFLLFLVVVGVLVKNPLLTLDVSNPASTIFIQLAGSWGKPLFGILLWAAGITSVLGAVYTSVSFLKTEFSFVEKYDLSSTIGFILFSLFIFVFLGKPASMLVLAGTLNSFVLPLGLLLLLFARRKRKEKPSLIWEILILLVVLLLVLMSIWPLMK